VKCALGASTLEPADYARLRRHGITDSEITETIAMCGFSMYAITVADALRLDIDPETHGILATSREASS
jgi:hypothetical protein